MIYKSIFLYRLVMNLLYRGAYAERFNKVTHLIEGKSVLELCFGDTRIAQYCRKNGIQWIGYDSSGSFVKNAQNKKLDARQADIKKMKELPSADTSVICGSLCYFHLNLENLLRVMLNASEKIIISEPVINLSLKKGFMGSFVRKMPFLEGSERYFRFDEKSLIESLDQCRKILNFRYEIVERFNKDIVVVIHKI